MKLLCWKGRKWFDTWVGGGRVGGGGIQGMVLVAGMVAGHGWEAETYAMHWFLGRNGTLTCDGCVGSGGLMRG